jgi:hypothetical protein
MSFFCAAVEERIERDHLVPAEIARQRVEPVLRRAGSRQYDASMVSNAIRPAACPPARARWRRT